MDAHSGGVLFYSDVYMDATLKLHIDFALGTQSSAGTRIQQFGISGTGNMTLTGTVTHRVVWNRTKCKILIGVNRTNMQIEATRGWRLQFGRNRIFGKGGRWPHAQTHAGLVCVCGERRASAAAIKLHVVR